MRFRLFNALLFVIVAGFCLISKLVFDKIYITSQVVIDEEFHIPQGLSYCHFKFDTWDPKITTLPGLYLVSALIMGPFGLCSVYWLRFINVLASIFNLLLFYVYFNTNNNKQSSWNNLLSSLNLSLLPPLYFFSHLYYTDVLSVTFVMLLFIFNKNENHFAASIFGVISILMRQTNVIWVLMVLGHYALIEILKHWKSYKHHDFTMNDLFSVVWNLKSGETLKKLKLKVWINILLYLIILISFGLFIVINGGITVGDKSAHVATLHIPQLFYFSLFFIIFAWPFLIEDVPDFIKYINHYKIVTLILMAIFAAIVHFNTFEHPYLLADNRHYTFYVWNRFYGRYHWFCYAVIPIYCFGIYSLLTKMKKYCNFVYALIYFCCVALVLLLQKMIEIRYFLIPYIIFRINLKNVLWYQLLAEFVLYFVINVATFYVFFTKDIYWSDFDYVQRLIW